MSSTVAAGDDSAASGEPKKGFTSMKTVVRFFTPLHLAGVVSVFVFSLDNIDKVLTDMGPHSRKSYLACNFIALVYFIFSRLVAKKGKDLRKAANVYRTNQYIYAAYEVEEGEATKQPPFSKGSTESTKRAYMGNKKPGLKIYLDNDGVEGQFNRAQRAIYNWQETSDQELVHILLCAVLLNYYMFIWAVTTGIGYVVFANGYTEATVKRYAGVAMATISRYAVLVMLVLLTIKTAIFNFFDVADES